jgi:hypothetical protein
VRGEIQAAVAAKDVVVMKLRRENCMMSSTFLWCKIAAR